MLAVTDPAVGSTSPPCPPWPELGENARRRRRRHARSAAASRPRGRDLEADGEVSFPSRLRVFPALAPGVDEEGGRRTQKVQLRFSARTERLRFCWQMPEVRHRAVPTHTYFMYSLWECRSYYAKHHTLHCVLSIDLLI